MPFIIVALGGGLGAVFRYALSFLPVATAFPLATFLTNLSGAFLIGLVTGISEDRKNLPPNAILFWKVGVCGGFTTFSSFSLDTVTLIEKEAYGLALIYSTSSILLCLIALMLGRYMATKLGGIS